MKIASISKHTPGPFELRSRYKTKEGILKCDIVSDGVLIASVFVGTEEGEANARLIAAAPELLEALRQLTYDTECYCSESPTGLCPVHKAEAAIAKAEGRQ